MLEYDNKLEGILGQWTKYPRFHHLLPYESYEPGSRLFYNKGSTGFVLSASPIVGASLRDQQQIAGFFRQEENLPEGASLQFLLFANPCIGPYLEYWKRHRKGIIFQKLAQRRALFLSKKAYEDEENLLIRNYELLISYTVPGHLKTQAEKDHLQGIRKELNVVLETLGLKATSVDAPALIQALGTLLNLDRELFPYERTWDTYDSLSRQMVDLDKNFHQGVNDLLLNDGRTVCKSYTPKVSPHYWSLANMDQFLGNVLEVRHRLSCPFLIHYGLFVESNQARSRAKVYTKRESLENSLKGGLSKFIPSLREQYEENSELCEQLQLGERVILSGISFTLFSTPQTLHTHEQQLRSILQNAGWIFQPARYDHLALLISSLPMTWTLGTKGVTRKVQGFASSLATMNKAKKTITKESQNLLPILGEWKGQASPGMPLIGRRGQLFFWNPFGIAFLSGETNAQTEHNYNVCIAGQSGSGKSVFMNELMATTLSVGGKVFILDYGRSFKKTCLLLQGQHIEFDVRFPLSLNPFTRIPSSSLEVLEREEMLACLCPVFQVMAAPKGGTSDLEDSLIEQGVRLSWERYKNTSSVDTVITILAGMKDAVAKRLAKTLFSFSSKGSFGHFFNTPATSTLKEKIVVIETDHLRNYPTLMAVVVQMLIIQINQEMARGDRVTPFLIMIDEAWKLLGGKNTADFISEATRTARKYKGSIVLGTQHLTDYFKRESPAATEAFNSSAWKCILYQESDVITGLKDHPQLRTYVNTDYKEELLRSVHSHPPHYSEIAIFGPDIQGIVGRLRLDPFSRLLYSTNSEEYQAIEKLIEKGASIEEAVEIFMQSQEQERKDAV